MKKHLFIFLWIGFLVTNSTHAQQSPQITKISGDIQAFGDIRSSRSQISPNGQWVVFIADAEQDEKIELYSVPIGGGPRVKLNSALQADGDVTSFFITPDSARVVFIADRLVDNRFELFSTPIRGGTIAQLNNNLSTTQSVQSDISFAYGPAQQTVLYRVQNQPNPNSVEGIETDLFSVDANGNNLTQLNRPDLRANQAVVRRVAISPNNRSIAFTSTSTRGSIADAELFITDIDASSPPIRVSAPIGVSNVGPVNIFFSRYTPDGQRILYLQQFNNRRQLFSLPAQGGTPIRLQELDQNVEPSSIRIAANSQRVIYALGSFFEAELYSVPTTGGSPVSLDTTSLTASITFVNNDQQVLYQVENPDGLRLISVTGGSPTAIDGPGALDGDVGFLSGRSKNITPDQTNIVYRARRNIPNGTIFDLRSVSSMGGTPRILEPMNTAQFSITPDSKQVIYTSRDTSNGDDIRMLFAVDVTGGEPKNISGELPFMSSVSDFQISPDSTTVVFRADKDIFDKFELFAVTLPQVEDDGFCLPIRAQNNKIAVICL